MAELKPKKGEYRNVSNCGPEGEFNAVQRFDGKEWTYPKDIQADVVLGLWLDDTRKPVDRSKMEKSIKI